MNLNPAHIHLLVNHIPVFGAIFAALLMAWGLVRKSEDVLRVGLITAVIIGILTWGVNLTGDPAIDFIHTISGVERARIHAHKEAGDLTTYVDTAAGVIALITLILLHRRRPIARGLSALSLLASLTGFGFAAYTANLGGEIRHPEIRNGFVPPPAPPGAQPGEGDEDRD